MTAVRIKNKLNIVTSELPQHEMFVNIFLNNMTEKIIRYEVSYIENWAVWYDFYRKPYMCVCK